MFCVANSKVRRDCDLRTVATNPRSFFKDARLTIKIPTGNTNDFYKKDKNGDMLYNLNYADCSVKPDWVAVPVCPRADSSEKKSLANGI